MSVSPDGTKYAIPKEYHTGFCSCNYVHTRLTIVDLAGTPESSDDAGLAVLLKFQYKALSFTSVFQSTVMSSQKTSLSIDDDKLQKANKIKALKQRIEELKTCLIHLEYKVGADKFKNIEHLLDISNVEEPLNQPVGKQAVDVEAQFCNDICRFAGFHCVRATKDQFVFHLSSGSKYKKEHVFMVQILIKEGKPSVGRWVMPPSVYMEILESEVPLTSTKDISLFLKTCRQYITCFVTRQEQYEAVKAIAPQKGKCSIQSNMGLTEIVLDFLNVRDIEQNAVLNLRVNLMYNAKEVRPHAMVIENKVGNDLSREALKHLKNSLKAFKTEDLNTAFEKVLTKENGPFIWLPPMDESIIHNSNEFDDSDDFEDKSIDSLASPKKRRRPNMSDDPDYEERSANVSRSRKKPRQTARTKQIDNADQSKENSASLPEKRTPAQSPRIKKVNAANHSKKNTGSSLPSKPKRQQTSRRKKVK